VYQFNVLSEHRHLTVEAESVVLAHEGSASTDTSISLAELGDHQDELLEEYFDFMASTVYVPHHLPEVGDLMRLAEPSGDATVMTFAQSASDLIHQRFRYVKGATHVHSSIQDVLRMGAGVCQDFAHLLLGVIRGRGLPARYVSGYIVPRSSVEGSSNLEEVIGGQASHAWVEAWLPGVGWFGLDPTLGAPVGLRHVRVAYGRDYGDVAPVRGVYRGRAGQRLSVDVRVRPGVDDDGHEQLQETASTPADPLRSKLSQQPEQQQQ
jgi:transglutaminase-like putative cysteine protease